VFDFERFRPELERAAPRGGSLEGWPAAVRPRVDVQGPDFADQNNLSARCEFYLRPVDLNVLPWLRRSGAGRQHHLDVSQGPDQGGRDTIVSASCRRPSSATPRPRSRRSRKRGYPKIGNGSRQTPAEGPQCTLDRQDHRGKAATLRLLPRSREYPAQLLLQASPPKRDLRAAVPQV
jgi:hypothetical protein